MAQGNLPHYFEIILDPKQYHSDISFNQILKMTLGGFPGGAVVKNPPANAGDTGSSPGPGRSHMPQSN